jgi:nucleoside-diphosphate-sugar epimerase
MIKPTSIFLAGASRGVGREIARLLRAQDIAVTALLRSESDRTLLDALGITVMLADAMDAEGVTQALLADPPPTLVISTIGGTPVQGERPDYIGNRNLIDAALQAKALQFILVSSIGTGDSQGAIPPRALEALGPVLAEKAKAEAYLKASGLTYTIIRPGGLSSEPATGRGVLTTDPRISGTIHRADVAQLVCQCIGAEPAYNQVFAAVDRELLHSQIPFTPVQL